MAPFLNGGLFTQNDIDLKYSFAIPDGKFQQVFNFLERYNFTIAEDSPLDKEVAVDPEMIGKVYESLVNVSTEADERGDAGIFYTPRTEIDLMCRLALVDFLANHLGQKNKNLLYEAVFALEIDEKVSADRGLAEAKLWPTLDSCLRDITVLDPACGSGSFLVGMLYILDDLQERANKHLGKKERAYERKKRIIGQNLYGVDVMGWACHVAELRLWLALTVDADFTREELHVRKEPLLPHFTFKIRCGDSLVQEIAGINLGYIRGSHIISPALKERSTKLKAEKLNFYNNDPACKFRSAEQAMQEELRLFREILEGRYHDIQEEIKRTHRKINGPSERMVRLDRTVEETSYQLDFRAIDWQKQLEALENELGRIDQARSALKTIKDVPFVWDVAFVEIFEGGKRGFDIVIGNPPYVRQENISAPHFSRDEVTTENKKEYKTKLARSVYQAFPPFFGYKLLTDTPAHKLNAKSDLYIYFYFHGLSLLNPKGSFCFITSNSWLDVGYGADFQEFLLKHCHVKMVLDNQARRSFASADVNTVIALFSSPDMLKEWGLGQTARFVMFKVPFEHILSPVIFEELESIKERKSTKEYRVYPINQKALLEDGWEWPEDATEDTKKRFGFSLKGSRYGGNKWGGKFLRAPDIYWTILGKGKGKLVRLGDIAEVRFGIKTGANEFFFLDEERIKEYRIEKEFLHSVIKSPKECKKIIVDPKELKFKIFMCHKDKKDLKGTAALEYIKWGEKQRFNERPSCGGRSRWWDLGIWNYADLLWVETMFDSYRVYMNATSIYESDKFYGILFSGNKSKLAISLNCSIVLLFKLMSGFASLGEGALKTAVYEVKDFKIPDIALINVSEVKKAHFFQREVGTIIDEIKMQDRRDFDAFIFEAIGLTPREQDEVYEAIFNLMSTRLKKASSLDPKDRRNRQEGTDD
jgi:hypothetical protein